MQFLIFGEEKFYASCTLKDKNFAPKQNERDCPMTGLKCLYLWGEQCIIIAEQMHTAIVENSQMAPYHFHRNYVTHGSGNSCRKTIIFQISFVAVW